MGNQGSRVDQQDPEKDMEESAVPEGLGHPRTARLYFYDGEKWLQSSQVVPEFSKEEDEASNKEAWFFVVSGQFEERVGDELRLIADKTRRTFHFYANQGSYCLKFLTPQGYEETDQMFNDYLFENTYELEATEENKMKIFGKTEYSTWCQGQDDQDTFWDVEDTPMEAEKEPTTPIGNVSERTAAHYTDRSAAHQMAMGALDSSFLVRSGSVDVFRNRQDGVESADVSISLQHAGLTLTPHKALLARREQDMLLLTPEPGKKSSVFQMDLEREKVVSEWKFVKDGVDVPMMDIAADTKSSQMESSSTFMGLDGNRLCQWDTRVARGVVSQMDSPAVALNYNIGHDFSRGTNFRCMATTGAGQVVVGSDDGKIRLYGHSAKQDLALSRAKTSFPGLGSPITHVDVTYDGNFVLATTDTYLIVICTAFKKDNGEATTGFKAPMAKHMQAPRLLRLLPADVKRTNGAPLKGGRFTWVTEQGRQERWIVASVGHFSVLWNFRRVKQLSTAGCAGGLKVCTDYHLSSGKEEKVIQSSFMHENFNSNCNQLVVATEHDVFSMANMDLDG